MIYRLVVVVLLSVLVTTYPTRFEGGDSSVTLVQDESVIEAKKMDPRALVLQDYLAMHNSPLQNHAQDFVDAADTLKIDWKLVPAIAGVESTFGKHIPGGFNGWGWGVYGTQAIYFRSWKDGIYTVSEGLKKNYIDRGLTDPYSMNRTYAASPVWGGKVAYFLNDIDRFSKVSGFDKAEALDKVKEIEPVIAGDSAKVNLFERPVGFSI